MTNREQVAERRQATIVLLETRTAWFPQPRSQFAGFGAVPGEKATERTECKPCRGSGVVNGRTGVERCVSCEGAGWYLVDGYTGKREQERASELLAGPDRQQWRRTVDGQLQRLALQLQTPSDVSARSLQDETPERWERERERHYRAGDYRALDLALEWLAGWAPTLHQVCAWAFEFEVLPVPERLAHHAVDTLNRRMPETIRVPHWYRPVSDETRAWRLADAARRNGVRPTAMAG